MKNERFNQVTFAADPSDGSSDGSPVRIQLTLRAPWKYSAGLTPDQCCAQVPYTEFDKLGGRLDRTGSIEFWYRAPAGAGEPDVVLKNWRIVDVLPGDVAIPVGFAVPRIVEYTIWFADFREQYVAPRGGRLMLGLINAGPSPAAAPDGVPEKNLDELIRLCLRSMGVADLFVPAGVSQIEAPRELKWFGNHAPTELDKLLRVAGCAFVPRPDGTGQVVKITTAGDPQITAEAILPSIELPSLDRRGTTVVFSSFPHPIHETLVLEGPRDDQWQFVLQDSKDQWQTPDQCDLVNQGGGLISHWQDKFTRIPEKYRQRVADQAYRCIRLGDGSNAPAGAPALALPPASVMPVLTRRIESDGSLLDLEVLARIALLDSQSQTYANSSDKVRVPAQYKAEGNILVLARQLLQVTQTTCDRFRDAKELKRGDFTVRFTLPKYEKQQDGTWRPAFYHVGFRRQGGQLNQLSDDELANALDGQGGAAADVIVIPRADFQLRIVQDVARNRAELEARGRTMAEGLLADSGDPTRLVMAKGFAQVVLNGLVSQVEWDQGKLLTTVTVNNWYRPAGSLDTTALAKAEQQADDAYPQQPQSQEQRTSLGEPGATRPWMPINPPVPGEPAAATPPLGVIDKPLDGAAGVYTGTLYSPGTLDWDAQSDWVNPGGLDESPTEALFVNLDEGTDVGVATGTHRLGAGTPVAVVSLLQTNGNPPRTVALVHGGVGEQKTNLKLVDPSGEQLDADQTTWKRDRDGVPLAIYLQTRSKYDEATGNFLEFQRELKFDARGFLYEMTGEEKIVIAQSTPECDA